MDDHVIGNEEISAAHQRYYDKHLPECPANWGVGDIVGPCPICPILRACETRVRKELEEYYNNPCMFCGPDSWSTYVCDECKEEFESEEEDE